jgi:hypothetical protein
MRSCITSHFSAELLSRYAADGSTPVEIDHEQVMRLGVRLHTADLLPDQL